MIKHSILYSKNCIFTNYLKSYGQGFLKYKKENKNVLKNIKINTQFEFKGFYLKTLKRYIKIISTLIYLKNQLSRIY